ncbi:IS5 family transposase [Streptomyces sp. NPDC050315]|uniref:IS5 family transposase n=1 Tax=Streptomyces sp. NPDC050315 TaxID=3155039 RepID=UPI003413F918
MGRGDLSDPEWARLERHLPKNTGRGRRWTCHGKVINGVPFRQRTGVPWRDLPRRCGKGQTGHDRHRRWSADGMGDRILRAVQADADVEGRIDWSMAGVDSTSRRAHQHAAGARHRPAQISGRRGQPAHHRPDEALGRSRGGLTTKIHLASDGGCRPLAVLVIPGQWGGAPQMIPILDRMRVPQSTGGHPRTRSDHVCGDKAYSSRRNRRYLRRRQIRHTIPERRDQQANRQRRGSRGGRPTGFDRGRYARRNEAERTVNVLKGFRAVATRYDKRAYVFQGTVALAAIRLWLR